MPFDITFHPVDPADLERFVFDVWVDPELATQRAEELSTNEAKRRFIVEALYGPFDTWRELAARDELRFGVTLGLVCAAVAGYRHDYFYGGASALSFAAERIPGLDLFRPIGDQIAAARSVDGSDGRLSGNYSASGLIMPASFVALRAGLDDLEAARADDPALFALFSADERAALIAALDYAEARGLALLEAADLVEPARRRGSTDLDRLRARAPRGGSADEPLEQLFACRRRS
jgi:hypothetical protein